MKKGWERVRLGELCQFRPPKSETRKRLASDAPVSFFGMEDLGIDEKHPRSQHVRLLGDVAGSYTYFAEGDVLLAKITPCFQNGKLGIAKDLVNGVGFGSSEFIVIRPSPELDREYLYYFLSRADFRIEGVKRMGGSVGHQRVPTEFVQGQLIPHVPLPEQRRIVGILDEAFEGIATARANAEKNLQNARALFESHLQAVFDRLDAPFVAIREVGTTYDGPHATPKTVDSGPIFLGISSLKDGRVILGQTRHVTPEDYKKWTRRVVPQGGDIVFSYETQLGQVGLLPEGLECCLGRRMALVRVNQTKVDPRYFTYTYVSPQFRKFLGEHAVRGATVDRISLNEFPTYQIPLPSLREQHQIADRFDKVRSEVDRLESLYQRKLAALDALKKSLLHRAFSGQL